MTDDLVKCLRDSCYLAFDDGTNDYGTAEEAADRIEKLEKSEKDWQRMYREAVIQKGMIFRHQYDLIEKLEAALRDCMEMAEVHEIPFRDRVMYISDIARRALNTSQERVNKTGET